MAILSYVTAKPILGVDPAGYVPFVEPADEYFVTSHLKSREYDELTFFVFDPSISTNIASFLAALKTDLDTNYAATSFTDATRDYLIDYRVTKVERTFNAPSTSIWEEREYVWKVSVQVRVNTNA
mgnify:CR=1 FL=1